MLAFNVINPIREIKEEKNSKFRHCPSSKLHACMRALLEYNGRATVRYVFISITPVSSEPQTTSVIGSVLLFDQYCFPLISDKLIYTEAKKTSNICLERKKTNR